MPEKKGRKRKPVRERSRGGGAGAAPEHDITTRVESRPVPPAPNARAALRWRYAGLVLALITAMVSILTIADVVAGGGYNTVNLVFRLVTGIGLGLLAIAIAAMVLIPDRLRMWLFRE